MEKTICALSTPPGIGGIAVIRLSGEKAFETADKCFKGKSKIIDSESHKILYGKFYNGEILIDSVTISIFRSPNSYTGEDVVEIGCHGGSVIAGEIIKALNNSGASLAEPGEFTKRAFLNGKLDLAQVEAVADLIHSMSVPGSQTAARQLEGRFTAKLDEMRSKLTETAGLLELELDFSEEDIKFSNRDEIKSRLKEIIAFCRDLTESFKSAEILRSGYFIGIAGYPNSGKSTFFNSLLERDRAIVSNTPGTTRDYLEESIMVDGIPVRIIDTAGFRESGDTIEIEGIKFAKSVLKQANLVIVLNDITLSLDNSIPLYNKLKKELNSDIIYINNKIDLSENKIEANDDELYISAKKGTGRNIVINQNFGIRQGKDIFRHL